MHRFDAAGQQLPRDNWSHHHLPSYYSSAFANNNPNVPAPYGDPFRSGNGMPFSAMYRGFQPVTNSRLACLLDSQPSDPLYMSGLNESSEMFYERLNRLSRAPISSPFRSASSMPEWMGSPTMDSTHFGRSPSQQVGEAPYFGEGMGYPSNRYGNVGGGGNPGIDMPVGNRYHPYYQPPHIPKQLPSPQPKPGFLEQLLKNRGTGSSSYPTYGNAPSSSASRASNSFGTPFHPGGQQNLGTFGMNNPAAAHFPANRAGYNGRYTGSFPLPYQPGQHFHPMSRPAGTGQLHPGRQQPGAQQNGTGHPNPPFEQQMQKLGYHRRNIFPVIPIDTEGEKVDEELPNEDAAKSEVRYRKNHERMSAIMDKTVANCDPISVPMERVESLRHYVELLKADVDKHKEDTHAVEKRCAQRFQDFMDSTAKFNSDYSKLCEPLQIEEYNNLVDQYYQEMKQSKNQTHSTPAPANAPTADKTENKGAPNNDPGLQELLEQSDNDNFPPKERSDSRSSDGRASVETVGVFIRTHHDAGAASPTPEENYFDNSGLATMLREDRDQEAACSLAAHQELHPPSEEMFPGGAPPESYGTQDIMNVDVGNGNDCLPLYLEDRQQPRELDYASGQPSTSSELANLLMAAPQHSQGAPPLPPQQSSVGWDHPHNSALISNEYDPQSQTYYGGGGHLPYKPSPQALMQNQVLGGYPPSKKRLRPSEELHDYISGLLGNRCGEESTYPAGQEPHQGQATQRRFLDGGGIVEMKATSGGALPEHSQPIIDVTREWFNSLTGGASAGSHEFEGHEEDMMPRENPDPNIFEIDLEQEQPEETLMVTGPSSSNQGPSNKNSKIAEILESPCLNNEAADEFGCNFPLEEAANGKAVEGNGTDDFNATRGNNNNDAKDEEGNGLD